jgi:glutaredoxin
MPRRRLVLYTRAGCHLCDLAKGKLDRARREEDFDLEEIDIDRDPDLVARYGVRIPVVTVDGVFAFEHRVVIDDLLRLLRVPGYEMGNGAPES